MSFFFFRPCCLFAFLRESSQSRLDGCGDNADSFFSSPVKREPEMGTCVAYPRLHFMIFFPINCTSLSILVVQSTAPASVFLLLPCIFSNHFFQTPLSDLSQEASPAAHVSSISFFSRHCGQDESAVCLDMLRNFDCVLCTLKRKASSCADHDTLTCPTHPENGTFQSLSPVARPHTFQISLYGILV